MKHRVITAKIQGSYHAIHGINCQDFVGSTTIDEGEDEVVFGCVLDGCGSGKYSEVGATLIGQHLLRAARRDFFHSHSGVEKNFVKEAFDTFVHQPDSFLSRYIHNQTVDAMKEIIRAFDTTNFIMEKREYVSFIKENLLTTVLFVTFYKNNAWVTTSGDGIVYVSDSRDGIGALNIINQNNAPLYMAYDIIPEKFLEIDRFSLPARPTTRHYECNTVILATDGAERFFKEERITDLFQKGTRGLQRKLNAGHVVTGPKRPEWTTEDDAAILIVQG